MKNKCLFCFLVFLLTIMRFEIIKTTTNKMTEREKMKNNKEIEDLIEYLAHQSDKTNSDVSTDNNIPNFLETGLLTNERGLGCEAMNKCSGKGTCKNGACMCDEGYDYFDCSVNVLSMYI